MIAIREGGVEDAPAIAKIHIAAMRQAYRGFMQPAYLDRADLVQSDTETQAERLAKPTMVRVLLGITDDDIAGYVVFGPAYEVDREEHWWGIYDLFVHPGHWRSGLGRALMNAAETELESSGCRCATLWVYRENQVAQAFYERIGWFADGTSGASGPPHHIDMVRFRKRQDVQAES